jgi:hypothetical protein
MLRAKSRELADSAVNSRPVIGMRERQKISQKRARCPQGQRRADSIKEAGRLRIVAEMNRWLATK